MSDEWLGDFGAIPLIRDARSVSEAVAVKLLIEACAESLVRARQRACWEEKDFGVAIPAFVWRDAHFADGVLFEAGTEMYTHPGEDGGYGYGMNGVIEFSAEDLSYWLNVAPAQRKQRSAPKGERIREAINALFRNGIPPQKDLPNSELIRRVRCDLKEHNYNVSFHDDLILREAGRKPKRSKAFKARSLMP
jgi:hypothetical protein